MRYLKRDRLTVTKQGRTTVRSSTVFAISAVVMLVIGLTMASITNAPRLTIPGKHGWIMFPAEIQYYLLAAVFCVIAFIEEGSRERVENAIRQHSGQPLDFQVAREGLRFHSIGTRQTAKV